MSNLNKAERQNQLIHVIQQNRKMTASELATALNVSKRTISRDIAELEEQGVRIFAQHGKLGGFQIQQSQSTMALSISEEQLLALFLTLNESQSYSSLPYKQEIQEIIQQCLKLPNTRVRKLLKRMDKYIKFDTIEATPLPKLFSDILIYSAERNVMSVDFVSDNKMAAQNVIFIGILCKNAEWLAIVFDIGHGCTRELPILAIHDISYSFEKTLNTHDITIDNYTQFLNPSD